MGKHISNADAPALQIVESSTPKPGSRRARRLAEQAEKAAAKAELAAKTNINAVAEADLATKTSIAAPTEVELNVAEAKSDSVTVVNTKRVVLPAGRDVYAEYMNERHVLSQVAVHSAPVRPRLFSRSRAVVLALVAMTSGLSVAAGAATFENPDAASTVEIGAAAVRDTGSEVVTVEPLQAKVTVDGKTTEVDVLTGATIAKLLDEAGITLSALDEVSLPLDTQVTEGLSVTVVRVTTEVITEEEVEKFTVVEEDDDTLAKGETKVETEGVDGKLNKTFEITYRDGKESAREVIAEVVLQKRVDKVVKVGTKEETTTTTDATSADTTSESAPATTGPVSSGSNRDIARSMLASFGWGDDQWPYLDQLWQRESGWNQYADNPYSSAYGIPQALPGSKMASAGADWATNPATQIKWGLGYIKSRYGSPAAAWAHSQSRGWY
ncbi:MAG: G5 domain-containing protein [Arcanobacterium sp.]|nr:G5 domain-containing protein [Arcanobacterium sp.]